MPNFYTELFIDNQEIDLSKVEDLPLNITRRVNSIDGKIQGDFSRASITVPATKNNKATLGDTRAYKPFRIEVDGQPSFNGIARARSGKNTSMGYSDIKETYVINLVSANSSWFTLLGDSYLSEFTELIVDFDEAEILLGFVSQPDVIDYGFAPIKLKEWENSTGAGPTLQYQPSLYETTPLLFLKPLITAAFNSIGWTIESEFFDTDYGKKLTMPTFLPEKMPFEYNEKYLNCQVSASAPVVYPNGTSTTVIFDTLDKVPVANPTVFDLVTGTYTCPLDGYYELIYELTFPLTPVPPGPTYTFGSGCTLNGTPIAVGGVNNISFTFPDYPAGQRLNISYIIFANAGDTIQTGLIWAFASSSITVDFAKLTINAEAVPSQGMPIDFKYLLGTYKFKDFLKGVIGMHNLSFESNEATRVVTIEPKDQYLNQTRTPSTSELKEGFYKSEQKDYSQLIDKKKKGSYKHPNVSGEYIYKYATDSDDTIDWLEGVNEIGIYEARYKMDSGADTGRVETKEVPFFSKTIHLLDYLARYPDTLIPPQFPLIYPQNEVLDPTATEAKTDIEPRILYFAGQRDDSYGDGQLEFFEFPGVPAANPLAFMVNYNDPTGLDPNLSFSNETVNGVESIGLVQKYYLHELARNNRGKIEDKYIKFNSVDFLNFTFRTKGFIDGFRYIVQNLKGYNPVIDAPTSFSFWEDIYPDEDDLDNVENSNLTGVVSTFST